MPLNSYVTLGRSGLRVSPFCLGAMTFGQDLPGFGASVEDSEAVLAHYLEEGGNFIDTANGYTHGHSEKILGDYFHQGKGERDRVVIATKFFMNLFAGDPNGGGAGRKAITGICNCRDSDRSLRSLSQPDLPDRGRGSRSRYAKMKVSGHANTRRASRRRRRPLEKGSRMQPENKRLRSQARPWRDQHDLLNFIRGEVRPTIYMNLGTKLGHRWGKTS